MNVNLLSPFLSFQMKVCLKDSPMNKMIPNHPIITLKLSPAVLLCLQMRGAGDYRLSAIGCKFSYMTGKSRYCKPYVHCE